MSVVNDKAFIRGVINKIYKATDQLSERELYTLAFLCEHQYYFDTGKRITDTNYLETMDGIANDELQRLLYSESTVSFEDYKYGNDKLTMVKIHKTKYVRLPEKVKNTIDHVVETCAFRDESITYAKGLIPREVALTTPINFNDLAEYPSGISVDKFLLE